MFSIRNMLSNIGILPHKAENIPLTVINKFNFQGPVPKDITWEQAWKYYAPTIIPRTRHQAPTKCFECHTKLEGKAYDYNKSIDQHMVWAMECPNGHGAFLKCA